MNGHVGSSCGTRILAAVVAIGVASGIATATPSTVLESSVSSTLSTGTQAVDSGTRSGWIRFRTGSSAMTLGSLGLMVQNGNTNPNVVIPTGFTINLYQSSNALPSSGSANFGTAVATWSSVAGNVNSSPTPALVSLDLTTVSSGSAALAANTDYVLRFNTNSFIYWRRVSSGISASAVNGSGWTFLENGTNESFGPGFWYTTNLMSFQLGATSAVPGAGVAALGSLGFAGIARRRRR